MLSVLPHPHAIFFAAVLGLCARVSRAQPVDVYILAGQSNMEGRADRRDLPPALREAQADILFFHQDRWGPLEAGSSQRPAPPNGFGPEISFGRTMADRAPPGRKVAIFKHAVGGTSLAEHWRAGTGEQSRRLLTKFGAAMDALQALGHSHRVVALVWMQGERDANTQPDAEAYGVRLREFIAYMRENLHEPQLPFIIGRITPKSQPPRPYSSLVRRAQEEVCATMTNAKLVDTDDLALFEEPAPDGKKVRVHFDAPSQVKLGRRLAEAVLTFEIASASAGRPRK